MSEQRQGADNTKVLDPRHFEWMARWIAETGGSLRREPAVEDVAEEDVAEEDVVLRGLYDRFVEVVVQSFSRFAVELCERYGQGFVREAFLARIEALREDPEAEGALDAGFEPSGPEPAVPGNGRRPRRRHVYQSWECSRIGPSTVRGRVVIACGGSEYTGEAEGPELPEMRAELTARAALSALKEAEGDRVALALKGARVVELADATVAVVGVYGLEDSQATILVGSCPVHNSIEQAVTQATLQATDRWLSWKATRQAPS